MTKNQPTSIVAYDDDGEPITKQHLVVESYRLPLKTGQLDLVAPFDFHRSDKEWDQQRLVKAVRDRRRAAKAAGQK